MRLGGWKARAPHKDAMAPKVLAVIEATLATLGSPADPECWISWGDDPATRYLVFVPTTAGLLQVHVRVHAPGEGPRASAKLIRWNRVQVGELALEYMGGHRLLSFQVEGQVLHGSDADAADIAAFALRLIAAIDGHPYVAPAAPRRASASKAPAKPATRSRRAATATSNGG